MISGWVLILAGALLAGAGTIMVVATGVVRHQELMRWLARRLRGDMPSGAEFGKPTGLRRVASTLSVLGLLIVGIGLAAVWPRRISQLEVVVVVVAVSSISFFFGIPQAIGRKWADPLFRGFGPTLNRLGIILRPVMPPYAASAEIAVAGAIRVQAGDGKGGTNTEMDFSGVWDYTTRPVREVMTPRTDVVAVKQGSSLEDVANMFAQSRYARMPIFGESLDDIVGMVYGFDLMKISPGGELPVRPVSTTPGLKTCAEVFLDLQRDRRQLAVVLDEFGGTAGIVTMEDLLTVLVGGTSSLQDSGRNAARHDVVELKGTDPVAELAAKFDLEDFHGSTTVGGFLARAAGMIPKAGDRFTLNGVEFDVLAATRTKIERVLVRRSGTEPIVLRNGEDV
ncbi:MAG: CBS domain-containing protein [Gemmatimonadota bacterium]|nr:CBS domain-containing protein [Gemmatimonadota bacterium]